MLWLHDASTSEEVSAHAKRKALQDQRRPEDTAGPAPPKPARDADLHASSTDSAAGSVYRKTQSSKTGRRGCPTLHVL